MRKSDLFILYLGTLSGLLLLSLVDAGNRSHLATQQLAETRREVRALELTDLSLFTEARYTRHLSQSDRHTPFQDHPLALEHFPSGSLVAPPTLLRSGR
jgi:hypothetical protein